MWLAGNSIGKEFVVTSFGESHGKQVGAVVDGCPAGLPFSEADVQADLDRRIPLQKPELVSGRVEKDVAQILSGVFNGFTTGALKQQSSSALYKRRVGRGAIIAVRWV